MMRWPNAQAVGAKEATAGVIEYQLFGDFPDVMSSSQAARALGTNVITLRKLIDAGKIRAVRLGRVWRISKVALIEFMEGSNADVA